MADGQQLPLRPLATAGGVAGHSWVLGQAVPGEVVELGLPRGWVPPSACAPLGLRLLEASTASPVDPVYLREQRTETSVAAGDREAALVQTVHSLKERQRLQNGLCGSVRKRTGAETAVAEGSALGHSPGGPWCPPPWPRPGKGQVWGPSPRGRPPRPSCCLVAVPGTLGQRPLFGEAAGHSCDNYSHGLRTRECQALDLARRTQAMTFSTETPARAGNSTSSGRAVALGHRAVLFLEILANSITKKTAPQLKAFDHQ